MLPQESMNREQALNSLSPEFDPYSDTSGLLGKIGGAISGGAKSLGKAASSVVKTSGKVASKALKVTKAPGNFIAKKVSTIPIAGEVYGAVHRLTNIPSTVLIQVLEGGNVSKVALSNLRQAVIDAKTIGPWVQSVVSFVPGVGQGIAGAIGAGLALADGKPISEAMIAAVKGSLPGGAAAQIAFSVGMGALQGKPIDQIAIGSLPISEQQKRLLAQGLQAAKEIAKGRRVDKALLDNAIKSLPAQYAKAIQIGVAIGHAKSLQEAAKIGVKSAASAAGESMSNLSLVQKVLSGKGAIGNAASGILSHMGSGLSGKNLERIGLLAANGGLPINIKKAIDTSTALRNGSPLLHNALKDGISHFKQNSPEYLGYATAIKVLKSNPNTISLGAARRSLTTEGAKRAFDAAIGTLASAANANPAALIKRPGPAPEIILNRAKGTISAFQPNLKHAIDTLKRNPALQTDNPLVLANKMGVTQQTVLQALKNVSGQRLLPWRSLSPRAANFVRKWHPNAPITALTHGTNDTSGLDETGTKYIVAKGDSPWSIAQKLSGNGNNWRQLIPLNKDKKPSVDKSVWVGEVLNIPASWQKPVSKPASPGPAASAQPIPDRPAASPKPGKVLVTQSVAPSVLQAKAILVAWSKTDGANQAGVTNYGQDAADMSTTFGPRDSMVLMSFQNWDNKTASAGLVVDGILGPKSLAALQSWAESRAKASAPSTPTAVVTTLPEVVITATPPVSSPGIPQSSTTPTTPTTPALPPVVVNTTATPIPSAPALPPVSTPAKPATASNPASTAANTKPGGSLALPIGGALVGGLLGGPMGAVVGGIGGALMS